MEVERSNWIVAIWNDMLGGCAIRDTAFASTQTLSDAQVSGVWQCSNSISKFQDSPNSILQELLIVDGIEKSVRDVDNLLLLPNNLWSSMKETEDGENACCEVGWLLDIVLQKKDTKLEREERERGNRDIEKKKKSKERKKTREGEKERERLRENP